MTWDIISKPQVHHFDLIHWLKTSPTQGLINSEISNHQIRVLNYQGLKIRDHIWETLKSPQGITQRVKSSSNNPCGTIQWKLCLNSKSTVINLIRSTIRVFDLIHLNN